MIATLSLRGKTCKADLSKPIDISIPVKAGVNSVNAFHIAPVKIEPVRIGTFVGDVSEGAPCNVNNVFFNPHGNGTHTECVGHITPDFMSINKVLTNFFFEAILITVQPLDMDNGDKVITRDLLLPLLGESNPEALVIRTLPNTDDKLTMHYSGTNPVYLAPEAALLIREIGVQHLLVDFPSVDREEDGGKLLAHRAFWNYPENTRNHCTITEFVYVKEGVADGRYLLNLMLAGFENDASPSKPILFKLED